MSENRRSADKDKQEEIPGMRDVQPVQPTFMLDPVSHALSDASMRDTQSTSRCAKNVAPLSGI